MRGWSGVGLVGGWQVVASSCFYAVFAATAFVREGYGLSRTVTGGVVTVVLVGYTVALVPWGAVVDAFGERPAMVWGIAVLGGGAAGVAFAPSFGLLLAALLVVGAAYGTGMPATNRAVLAVAPSGRHSLAMNVKQVGVTVGSGAGALLVTAAATTRFGWRAGFLVVAAAAAVVALAFAVRYRGRPGSGTLSLPDVRGLLAVRGYPSLVAAGLFLGAAIFTTTGYVVLHMTEAAGASAGLAGAVLAAVQVAGSAGRLGGGAVADRLPWTDARANAAVLAGQGALAGVGFLVVTVAESSVLTAAAFVLLGVFVVGFPGIYYACMTALVPEEEVGAATAAGQFTVNVGGLAAPPAFGYLADTLSYDAGWAALAACAGVATLLTLRLLAGSG